MKSIKLTHLKQEYIYAAPTHTNMQTSGKCVLIWLISMCWVAMKHLPQTQAQLFVLATTLQPCNPPWPQSIIHITHTHTHKTPFPKTFTDVSDSWGRDRVSTSLWSVRSSPLWLNFGSAHTHTHRDRHMQLHMHTYIYIHMHVTQATHPSLIT